MGPALCLSLSSAALTLPSLVSVSWLRWFGKGSSLVVSIEGESEEGDGGAELERDGDARHRYAGRGTGNPFSPGGLVPLRFLGSS